MPSRWLEWSEDVFLAEIRNGRDEANAGDPDAAERRFVEVLSQTRGTGSDAEIAALSSLVTLYSREQRDFETLPLARRLVEHGRERNDPYLLCRALGAVVGAFNDLDDASRTERSLAELEAALPSLRSHRSYPHYRRILHGTRSDLALSEGDRRTAAAELEKFRCAFRSGTVTPGEQLWRLVHEAHVAMHFGAATQTRGLVAEARGLGLAEALGGLALEYLDLWSTFETEDSDAMEKASQLLEHLQGGSAAEYGVTPRLRYLSQIGDLLRARGSADLAYIAYDLAGTAAIVRILQLHRVLEEMPEIEPPTSDDRAALVEYRQRFKAEHSALLRSVATLFEIAWRSGEIIPSESSMFDDNNILICAWCEQVRLSADSWLPVGHFVPTEPELRVQHGICPRCARILHDD